MLRKTPFGLTTKCYVENDETVMCLKFNIFTLENERLVINNKRHSHYVSRPLIEASLGAVFWIGSSYHPLALGHLCLMLTWL